MDRGQYFLKELLQFGPGERDVEKGRKKRRRKNQNRQTLMAGNKPRGDAQPVMRMPDGTLAPIPFGPADAKTARGRA